MNLSTPLYLSIGWPLFIKWVTLIFLKNQVRLILEGMVVRMESNRSSATINKVPSQQDNEAPKQRDTETMRLRHRNIEPM